MHQRRAFALQYQALQCLLEAQHLKHTDDTSTPPAFNPSSFAVLKVLQLLIYIHRRFPTGEAINKLHIPSKTQAR